MLTQIGKNPVHLLSLAAILLLQACGTAPTSEPGAPEKVFDQSAYSAALSLMEKKEYEKAAVSLEEIARSDDRRAGPYINLGIAYRQLGKLDDAKQALLAATKRRQSREIAWNEIGIVYRKLGEFSNAREAYRNSIREQSGYRKAHLNLGILCDLYLQDLGCAIRSYEKYLKLENQQDKTVTLWLADVRKRAGKPIKRAPAKTAGGQAK